MINYTPNSVDMRSDASIYSCNDLSSSVLECYINNRNNHPAEELYWGQPTLPLENRPLYSIFTSPPYEKLIDACQKRVNVLKEEAYEEGHVFCEKSEGDLIAFLHEQSFSYRPVITLLSNGNLRALWKDNTGEQIGLQFRGGGEVQYVLFVRCEQEGLIDRAAGRETLDRMGERINRNNWLLKLMSE